MQQFQLNLGTCEGVDKCMDTMVGRIAHHRRSGPADRGTHFDAPQLGEALRVSGAGRQPGGHRRYGEADVEAVLDVLARRDGGPLARPPPSTARRSRRSGRVRLRRPAAPVPVAPAAGAVETHAGVDEPRDRGRVRGARRRPGPLRGVPARAVPARVVRPVARARPHGPVRCRLRRLPPRGGRAAPPTRGVPVEVAVPPESPLNREWLVVCDAADLPACLVAVERPGQGAEGPTRAHASRPSGRSTRRSSATPAGSPARWPRAPAGLARRGSPCRPTSRPEASGRPATGLRPAHPDDGLPRRSSVTSLNRTQQFR